MNEIVKVGDIDLENLQRIAKMLAASGYFDAARDAQTGIAQMATKILAGREMGYGPFASVQGIHIIQGKPALSAGLMASAVKASKRYGYNVITMDATVCTLEFYERTSDGKQISLGLSTFTIADARQAKTQNLEKFPRNMLFARALSNGVKWYAADVFNGNTMYTPEELGATVDDDGGIIVDSSAGEVVEKVTEPKPKHLNGNAPAPVVEHGELDGSTTRLRVRLTSASSDFGEASSELDSTELAEVNPLAELEKECEALGKQYYAERWDTERSRIILWLTKDRTSAMSSMFEADLVVLNKKLQDKIAKYGTAAQAEIKAVTGK